MFVTDTGIIEETWDTSVTTVGCEFNSLLLCERQGSLEFARKHGCFVFLFEEDMLEGIQWGIQ